MQCVSASGQSNSCFMILMPFKIRVHGKLVPLGGHLFVTGTFMQEKQDWNLGGRNGAIFG